MTSTNFMINWSSVNSGGGDAGTSTSYLMRDTLGDQATGFSTSTNYTASAGYRAGDQDEGASLHFKIGTQENATQVSYSFFSVSSSSVIVGSAASFAVDQLIGVAEDVGASQLVSVGKISDISGNVITVDRWDGATSTMSSIPAGSNDFVYRLEGSGASLGALSASVVKTSITATDVTSDAANGYTVSIYEDGDLRYTSTTVIFDVADASVTAGSEEYGWRPFGQRAANAGQDNAFTTTTKTLQQSSGLASDAERVGLVYKAAISNNTPAGVYAHVVYFVMTANY